VTIAILIVLSLSLLVQAALLFHLCRERVVSARRQRQKLELTERVEDQVVDTLTVTLEAEKEARRGRQASEAVLRG
jgi:hypothetical protein